MVNAQHGTEFTQYSEILHRIIDKLKVNGDVILLTKSSRMNAEDENEYLSVCGGGRSLKSWKEFDESKFIPLEPPLEFRDNVNPGFIEKFAGEFISKLILEVCETSSKLAWSIPCSQVCHTSPDSQPPQNSVLWNGLRLCWTPELFATKKHSSAFSTCLSSSHNSLSTIGSSIMDVSDHIKSAISHDVLTSKQITDMYNVPFDSDIYALPVDVVPGCKSTSSIQERKTTIRNSYCHSLESKPDYSGCVSVSGDRNSSQEMRNWTTEERTNRGLARKPCFSSSCAVAEPIHVTVDDVRRYLKTLYARSNETAGNKTLTKQPKENFKERSHNINNNNNNNNNANHNNLNKEKNGLKRRSDYIVRVRYDKAKENASESVIGKINSKDKLKKWSNIKEALCNIFRLKRLPSPNVCLRKRDLGVRSDEVGLRLSGHEYLNPPSPITKPPFSKRALPPLPGSDDDHGEIIVTDSTPLPSPEDIPSPSALPFRSKEPPGSVDFASSIEKVKDCGWYWGPISGEAAEKILSNEPDGSFIVRDSSDDYYIFSLTFKLNSIIRHVRIEHDQGNFSFGSSTRFKSHTIVDFIESAVEHSRSGRYLFFLHRRPVLGPMRVQLLHPVSRFKQVQSLQHMCRFVILKMVRRDLIRRLPLPRRILDYLSTKHYYSENLTGEERSDSASTKDDDHHLWAFDGEEGFS